METVRQEDERSVMGQILWYWLPVVLYAGAIFYLSDQPHRKRNCHRSCSKIQRQVLHAVEYGILALLCYRAFRWRQVQLLLGRLSAGHRDCLGLRHDG